MKQNEFDGSKVFMTSDTHFGHKNIISFCSRPYKTVEEMDEALIKNWNRVVPSDGIVFHLGDFSWGGLADWERVRKRLNGKIYLILGNHDIKVYHNFEQRFKQMFEWVGYQMQIVIDGQPIYLNHYPFLCYGGSYRGEKSIWQCYGHVHSSSTSQGLDVARLKYTFPYQLDVGVDNFNYTPVSFQVIKDTINKQIESNGLWMRSFNYGIDL